MKLKLSFRKWICMIACFVEFAGKVVVLIFEKIFQPLKEPDLGKCVLCMINNTVVPSC